jgi:phosphatidylglycerol:prolipoprotein diacylglycerol transferase
MTIPIGLDPVAFEVLGLQARWYGLLAVLAIAVALLIVRAGLERRGIRIELLWDGALWVGVAALVGGRALYLIQNELPDLAAHPLHALAIWHGGLSFYGGLVAGLVALWFFARRRRLRFGIVADLVAPAAAAGQAIGHLGCFIGGDSYGLPTTGPLAVSYWNPAAMAPQGVPLVPTQLYEAVALAVLAGALWVGRDRLGRLGAGAVAATYLLGNAVIRFGLFYLRDDVVVFDGLKVAQLFAIGIAFVGVAWLVALRRPAAELRLAEARP